MKGGHIGSKRAAILMVAVLAVASLSDLALANFSGEDTSADTYTHVVTYHPNGATGSSVSVSYDGIISTEYNPLYWANSFSDSNGDPVTTNWTAPSGSHTYTKAGAMTLSKVFAGWSESASPSDISEIHDPGDVIPATIEDLYAYWVFPDIFEYKSSGTRYTDTMYISYSSSWYSSGFKYVSKEGNTVSSITTFRSGDAISGISTMYTHQYQIRSAFNVSSDTLPTGSYRSQTINSPQTFTISGQILAGGDVIIDNVRLAADTVKTNHGYDLDHGLFANNHKLIMGAGIISADSITVSGRTIYAPQVYGGTPSSAITGAVVTNKEIVSGYYDSSGLDGDDDNLYGLQVNLGTFVLIHSGVYANVFAGGGSNVGTARNPLSTYLVMKGGTVLDTLCGGNAPADRTIYGAGYSQVSDAPVNARQGGTFLYITGGLLPGEAWSTDMIGLGNEDYNLTKPLTEAVALVAGSARATIIGSTHLFLSGKADVWDAQGGGRSAFESKTTFGYAEASGSAIVRHILCGAVTDGTSQERTCIYGTKVILSDNAKVATLCGAGYDTWQDPQYTSMAYSESIEVLIAGGNVGFVYGGGFRGTVGADIIENGVPRRLNISVDVTGGVVQYDLFGGGRGGLDKALLYSDSSDASTYGRPTVTSGGAMEGVNSWRDSTGYSKSYANITVTLTNADIRGSVYGGGESIASLSYYKGYFGEGSRFGAFDPSIQNVAEVFGSTTVTVNAGTVIGGSVYGAGKGIGVDGGTVVSDYAKPEGGNVSNYYSKVLYYGASGFFFNEWFVGDNDTITYDAASVSGYAMVTGTSTVNVNGGNITHSVYGGGALGITTGNTNVNIDGGNIGEDVYGGGLGTLGNVSVTGNTILTINDGNILGSVYAGSRNGINNGTTALYIYGGYVAGNAFAGGLGASGEYSVRGKRTVRFDGGSIAGSLYGGSSLGNDEAQIGNPAADVEMYILSGEIGASVFGGGFKGVTSGSSYIYVGYNYDKTLYTGESKTLTIGQSIYGGGDIGKLGDGDKPFDPEKIIFTGDTQIRINGSDIDIDFTGSIFGSGNSCIVAGSSFLEVRDLTLGANMESIHRFSDVTIWRSTLKFDGRESSDGTNTKYSFYNITDLKFKEDTTVYLYAQMMNISSYSSLGSTGNPTVSSSPSNSIVICDGTLFAVQSKNNEGVTYNLITGYTRLSLLNTESYYGAYAMGSVDSVGGFVIQNNGSYKVADSIYSTNCRCWFVSGTMQLSQSVTTDIDTGSIATMISMPRVSNITGMRYTSGYFVPSSDSFHLTDDLSDKGEGYFKVTFGADNTGDVTFNNRNGAIVPAVIGNDSYVDDRFQQYIDGEIQDYSVDALADIGFRVDGTTKGVDLYIGYVMIYLQEVTYAVDSSGGIDEIMYIVQNRCEIKVNIYTSGNALDGEGNPNVPDNVDIVVSASQTKAGSANVIIPQGLVDYSVRITGATKPQQNPIPITVESYKNDSNSNGWTGNLNSYTFDGTHDPGLPALLGRTQGGYSATIRFSVGTIPDIGDQEYHFTVVVSNSDGSKSKQFNVNVIITYASSVNITFHDSHNAGEDPVYPFPYGSVLSEASCPATAANFVGWYMDSDYNNPYNFNSQLTTSFTLYARYAYQIVFDHMNGTSSQVFVGSDKSHIARPDPDPTWAGHTFVGWYKENTYVNEWDFENDTITGDTTLYAKWSGNPVTVKFIYDANFGIGSVDMTFLEDNSVVFTDLVSIGDVFGNGQTYQGDFITSATALMLTKLDGTGLQFVRWQVMNDGGEVAFPVYDDTEVPSNISMYLDTEIIEGQPVDVLYLTGDFAITAIYVDMEKNVPAEEEKYVTIESPLTHLIYPSGDGKFRFYANNATRSNGYRLIGWCLTPVVPQDKSGFVDVSNEWVLPENTPSSSHITLYAIWEPITYNVTIVKPHGGVITVFDTDENPIGNTSSGDLDLQSTFNTRYLLKYTPGDGYQFGNWHVNGEGTFSSVTDMESYLTVKGDCAVYAQLTGMTRSTIYLRVDGAAPGSDPGLHLSFGGEDYADLQMDGTEIIDGLEYAKFPFTSKVGSFDVVIRGTNNQISVIGTIDIPPAGTTGTFKVITVDSSGFTGKEYIDTAIPQYIPYDGSFGFSILENYEEGTAIVAVQNGSPLVNTGSPDYEYTSGGEYTVTITGSVVPVHYDVTYTTTGETGTFYFVFDSTDYASPKVVSYEYGTVIPMPTAVKDSGRNVIEPKGTSSSSLYVFMGWFLDSAHTRPYQSGMTVEGDVTLYAYIALKGDVHYTVEVYHKDLGSNSYTLYRSYDDTVKEGNNYKEFTLTYEGFNQSSTVPANYTNVVATADSVVKIYYDRATRLQTISFADVVLDVSPVAGWDLALDGRSMSKTVEYGESVTLPGLTKTGYRLTWDIDGETQLEVASYTYDSVTLSAGTYTLDAITIAADFIINNYNLTLTTARGYFDDGGQQKASITISVPYGSNIAAAMAGKVPVAVGYTQDPEKLWRQQGQSVAFDTDTPMPANDLTLLANWIPNTYTIIFNGNGGTLDTTSIDATYDVNVELPSDGFTYAGHSFVKWNTLADGTGMDYAGGASVKNLTAENGGEFTLYAIWSLDSHTVTINYVGAPQDVPQYTASVYYGNSYLVNSPTFAGYTVSPPIVSGTMGTSDVLVEVTYTPIEYEITYNLNGGTVDGNPATYNIETATFTLINPTRTGYTFAGWTGTGLDGRTMTVTVATGSTGARSYTANWETNVYTITWLNYDGSTITTTEVEHGQMPVYTGSTPVRSSTAQYDYTFNTWSPAVVAATQNTSYTATFNSTLRSYTITFKNENGSVLQSGLVQFGTTPVYSGATPTKASTAQYDYTFNTWSPAVASVSGDAIYTATFTETLRTYAVTITGDGLTIRNGETPISSGTQVSYGTTLTIVTAVRTGYTPNVTVNGAAYAQSTVTVTGATTVTLEYVANQHTITYRINGNIAHQDTYSYGDAVEEWIYVPAAGEEFSGWSPAFEVVTMPDEDLVFTATTSASSYNVTFNTNGGTINAGNFESYTFGTEKNLPTNVTKVRTGYTCTFQGWYDNAQFTGSPVTKILPTDMGDKVFYAKWQEAINQYTITFDTAGGSSIDPITQDYGTGIAAPSDPTRTGYTFTGWDTEIPDTMPAANMTITAGWEINQYTITFNTDGGSVIAAITQDYGTAIVPPSDPTKQGFTFAAWDTEIPATMPATDMTITALWYSVTGFNGVYDGASHTVAAVKSTGLTVKYSDTVDGSYIETPSSYTDAGSYTVYYKVYMSETEVSNGNVSIVISPKTVAVPTPIQDLVYSGLQQTGVLSGTGYTLSGHEAVAAGNHTATATLVSGNYIWSDSTTAAKDIGWSIAKKGLNVTADNKSVTYGDVKPSFTVQYSGFVNGETQAVLGGELAYTCAYEVKSAVGSYPITPSGLTSDNYNISFIAGTLTVGKKTINSINWTGTTVTYDGNAHKPVATPSGILDGDSCGVIVSGEYTNAGTYDITASGVTNANYQLAEAFATTLTIQQKEVTLIWGNAVFTYDSNMHVPSASANGLVQGDNCTVTVSGEQRNAGTYTATATGLSNSNYKLPAANTTSFKINKADYDMSGVTFTDGTFEYDAEQHNLAVSGTLPTGADEIQVTVAYSEGLTDVGSVTVTATFSTTSGNYNVPVAKTATLTVTKKQVTITGLGADDKEYDGTTAATVSGSPVITGKIGNDDVSVVLGTASFSSKDVGNDKTVTFMGYSLTGSKAGNYELTAQPASVTADITKKNLTVTAEDETISYCGIPALDVTYDGFVAGEDVNVLGGDLSVTTDYVAGTSGAGEYDIVLSGLTSDNYDIIFNDGTLTVQKVALTITAKNESVTYGDAKPSFTVNYTGFVNGETSAVLGGSLVYACTYEAGSPVGSYTITPSGLTSGNYDITFVAGTLTVTKKVLSVTVNDVNIAYGDAIPSYSVEYSGFIAGDDEGDLGGSLVYTCTYIQGSNAGNYTVSASGLTSGNYNITFTEGTLTVAKRTAVLNWTNTVFTFNNGLKVPVATVTNLYGSDVCTVTVTGAQSNAGTYTATATALSNSNYALPAEKTVSFTINKANYDMSGVHFDDAVVVYDKESHSIVITGTLPIGADGIQVTVGYTGSRTDVGDETITATFSTTSGNYYVPESMSAVLTIAPKEITLAWTGTEFAYDGASHIPTAAAEGLEDGDSCTVTVTGAQVNAGSYTATATALSNSNYMLPLENTVAFVITKIDPVYTVTPATLTYTGTAQNLVSATVTGGTISYSLTSRSGYSGTIPTGTNAGAYTVYFEIAGDANHNDIEETPVAVTIAKKALSITADNKSIAYGADAPTYTVTYVGFVNDETKDVLGGSLTFTCSYEAGDPVGSYPITPSGLTSGNYEITFNNGTLAVGKSLLTITAVNVNIVYGDAKPVGQFDVIYDGFIGEDDPSVLGGTLAFTCGYAVGLHVGTYDIEPSGLTSDDYVISFVKGTLSVGKRTATLNWTGTTSTYDGTEHKPAATVSNLVGEDVCIVTVTGGQINAGEYTATATDLSNSDYQLPADPTVSFTISKADYNMSGVVFADQTVTYDGQSHTIVISGTLPTGEDGIQVTVGYTGSRTAAGNETITATFSTTSPNYNVPESMSATLTVGQKVVTLGWTDTEFTYDGQSHVPSAEVTNLVAGDECNVTVTGGQINAGAHTATATALSNPNYQLPAVNTRTFSISKVSLTVTADNASVTYGDAKPSFTVHYTGFVNGETEAVLGGALTFTCGYAAGSSVDHYAIIPAGLTSGNYNISFIAGMLDVVKRTAVLNWTDLSFTYDGSSHKPSATVSNLVGEDVCTVTVTGAEINARDQDYTATAVSLSNPNYQLSAEKTAAFHIGKADYNMSGVSLPITSLTYDGQSHSIAILGDLPKGIDDIYVTVTYEGSLTDVGSITVRAIFATESTNYNVPADKTATLTITQKSVTITGLGADGKVYDGTDAATISGSPVIDGKVGNDDVSVIMGSAAFSDVNAGTGRTVTFSGFSLEGTKAGNYELTGQPESVTADISKRTAELGWSVTEFVYDKTEKAPAATVQNLVAGDVCTVTVSGAQVNAGTYTATASALSNDNYELPDNNTIQFTIAKKGVTITGTAAADKVYDKSTDAEITDVGTLNGVIDGDTVTISPVSASFSDVNAGTDKIVTFVMTIAGADSGNYELTVISTATADITPKEVGILWTNTTFTYDGHVHVPVATASSGLMPLDVCDITVSGGQTNAGEYIATAACNNSNYKLPAENTRSFIIEKANYNMSGVSFNDAQYEYDGVSHTITVTGTLPTGLDGIQVTVGYTGSRTAAGEETITATFATTSLNYNVPASKIATLTITKRVAEIVWSETSFVYNGTERTPVASVSNIVTGDVCTVTVTGGRTVVGNYQATATELSNVNYQLPANVVTAFTINKADYDMSGVLFQDAHVTYDGGSHTIEISGVLPTGADDIQVTVTYEGSRTNVGSTVITANFATVSNNYNVPASMNATLTIDAREITIVWGSKTFTYDGQPHIPTATAGNVVEGTCNLTVTGEQTHAGEGYVATVTSLDNDNYKLPAENTTEFTIEKRTVSITWTNVLFAYDGASHVPTAEVGNIIPGDVCNITVTGDAVNAGIHNAVVSTLDNTNYKLVDAICPFEITKKALDVFADDKAVTYGDDVPVYTHRFDESDFVPGDDSSVVSGTPVYTCTYTIGSGAGAYTITVSGLTADNYEITYHAGTLNVAKKALDITADDKAVTYGDAATEYTITIDDSDFIPGDDSSVISGTAVYTCTYTIGSGAGEYTITVTGLNADNYEITYHDGTLNVAKKVLDITADDKAVTYGDNIPAYTVTYDGFIPGDSKDSLGGSLVFDCGYSVGSGIGTYDIIPSGQVSDNYVISYHNGILTVSKITAEIVITANSSSVPGDASTVYSDNGFTFTQGIVIAGDALEATVVGEQHGIGSTANVVTSYKVTRNGADVTANYANFSTVDGIIEVFVGHDIDITNGASAAYDSDVIDVEGFEGDVIRDGDSFDLTIKAKTDVKAIYVTVKMDGVEIDAFIRDSDTSGRVHIDSVTGDVEVAVSYSAKDAESNLIPIILILSILIPVIIVGVTYVAVKKRRHNKEQQQ